MGVLVGKAAKTGSKAVTLPSSSLERMKATAAMMQAIALVILVMWVRGIEVCRTTNEVDLAGVSRSPPRGHRRGYSW